MRPPPGGARGVSSAAHGEGAAPAGTMAAVLTHFRSDGAAHMVDVGAKDETRRAAVAEGRIEMRPETLRLIVRGGHDKGDVLGVARIAAIQAAKRTADLIPLCHPIPLTRIEVDLEADGPGAVGCRARAETVGRTGVEIRGCEETRALVADAVPAAEEDWGTEYLAAILAVRVVEGIDEAMAHIGRYGSGHTDAIVTGDLARARRFIAEVDSSSVMVNAPTCFADGFEYGLGAEIGISTDKLHARGPVGLEGLTTRKFIVLGNGQVRG